MHIAAAVVFAINSITDYLDGYLALVMLLLISRNLRIIGRWDASDVSIYYVSRYWSSASLGSSVIICRELAVTGLRLY